MCGFFRWAEGLDSRSFEIVDDAGAKRGLGADHHQIDSLLLAEGDHRRMVGGIERHNLRLLRDPGIARRAIEPLHQRARRQRPAPVSYTHLTLPTISSV